MGIEIERRFLLKSPEWFPTGEPERIMQGYFWPGRGSSGKIVKAPSEAWAFLLQPSPGVPPVQFFLPEQDGLELAALHPNCLSPEWFVRIRSSSLLGGVLTMKGPKDKETGLSRHEYEYLIQPNQALSLLTQTEHPIVKDRYRMRHEGYQWEIDVFRGKLEGLVLCEVELDSCDERPPLPVWVGQEVTNDKDYRVRHLLKRNAELDCA